MQGIVWGLELLLLLFVLLKLKLSEGALLQAKCQRRGLLCPGMMPVSLRQKVLDGHVLSGYGEGGLAEGLLLVKRELTAGFWERERPRGRSMVVVVGTAGGG